MLPSSGVTAREAKLAGARHVPALGVSPCDQLWLTPTNTGGKVQNVSVFYFAAGFTVAQIWPVQNPPNRLAPVESAHVGLMIKEDSTAGLEEIWVLAVPVDPDATRVDLTRLATQGKTRAADHDPPTGAPDPRDRRSRHSDGELR